MSATAERLEAIQAELSSILQERLTELNRTLRETESTTRRIIGAEIELERHRASQGSLDTQLARMRDAVDADRASADELDARRSALVDEQGQQASRLQLLEAEVRELGTQADRDRGQVAELEAEAERLRSENASLRTKQKTLEENLQRMRKIKDDLEGSISGLTAQMSTLAGGSPE